MAGTLDKLQPAQVQDGTAPPQPDGRSKLAATSDGRKPAGQRTASAQASKPPKVIKFSHVSKRFVLHHERPRSFQDMVVSLFGLRTPSRRGLAMPEPVNQEFWALRDVNFSIYAGEAVGIVGENGSGKSTSLKLISRILEPTSGSVSVRGKVSALLELGTGFHPDLTGRENIFLNGSLLGLSRKEMASRYDQIVDFAELGQFIDTPIKHYSSGMVMRLGFAVAINVDPDILLTDEVLAVGDEAFQRKCLEQISLLRKRGVTIIFVSHALEAVRSLCQRAIWLDHGRLIADGPAGEVIDRYLAYENEKHAERLKAAQESRPMTMPNLPSAMVVSDDGEDDGLLPWREQRRDGVNRHEGPELGSDVRITDVTFHNASGAEGAVFQTGQPLTIRLHYDASARVDDPTFGLAIYTENGAHVNGPNTRYHDLRIPYIEGAGYVDYEIASLPLQQGRYYVTVAVTGPEMTDIKDHQHRAYSFLVQPTPTVPDRNGMFYIPARWTFHPDAPDGD